MRHLQRVGHSLLSAGFIIWAISGWLCFSRRNLTPEQRKIKTASFNNQHTDWNKGDRTCEACQLAFRLQKWNLKAHMWCQLSPFSVPMWRFAMKHHLGNIQQLFATPRNSATPSCVSLERVAILFLGLRHLARNAPSCFKSSPETMKPQKAGRMTQTSTCCGVCEFSRRWPASIQLIVLNAPLFFFLRFGRSH